MVPVKNQKSAQQTQKIKRIVSGHETLGVGCARKHSRTRGYLSKGVLRTSRHIHASRHPSARSSFRKRLFMRFGQLERIVRKNQTSKNLIFLPLLIKKTKTRQYPITHYQIVLPRRHTYTPHHIIYFVHINRLIINFCSYSCVVNFIDR